MILTKQEFLIKRGMNQNNRNNIIKLSQIMGWHAFKVGKNVRLYSATKQLNDILDQQIFDIFELAAVLKVCHDTLIRQVRAGKITPITPLHIGRLTLFSQTEVINYILKNRLTS